MLLNEFIDRTNYHPSPEEWANANALYMDGEMNKDEFCRLWVKMNKGKVTRQIADRKRKEELWKRFWKIKEDYVCNRRKMWRARDKEQSDKFREFASKSDALFDEFAEVRDELCNLGQIDMSARYAYL